MYLRLLFFSARRDIVCRTNGFEDAGDVLQIHFAYNSRKNIGPEPQEFGSLSWL